MRTSSLLAVLTLAGCSQAEGERPAGKPIECALDNAAEFASTCFVERRGDAYILHGPDGRFRRLDAALEPLDGADPAEHIQQRDDTILVSIAGDRYRIPPNVRPD